MLRASNSRFPITLSALSIPTKIDKLPRLVEERWHGTLHAKCVLVDSDRLFVSSANMTSFALALNIELGVLLNGGDAPRQMERNLTELIRTGVLREDLRPV